MSTDIYSTIENKYKKWYFNIIENTRQHVRIKSKEIYYEKHHIIPKSLGGTNEKDNLVLLTAKEHLLVHWLLCKMFGDVKAKIKMEHAFCKMVFCKTIFQHRKTPSLNQIAECKRMLSINMQGVNNPQYGVVGERRSKNQQRRLKGIDSPLYGKKLSPDHVEKMRQANLGKKASEKTKEKMRLKRLGVKNPYASACNKLRSKEYIVTNPNNETFYVKNMAEFCRKNNLDNVGMCSVAKGNQKTHRKWKCKYYISS